MRDALSLPITLALLLATASAEAQQTDAKPPSPEEPRPAIDLEKPPAGMVRLTRSQMDLLGLRYDVGTASSYGLGYLHAHEFDRRSQGWPPSPTWLFAYGVDARLHTADHERVDAVSLTAVGRAQLWGTHGSAALEFAAGVATGPEGTQGLGQAGVYMGLYLVELGYSLQFPLGPSGRPDWMGTHQFSVRLQLPVASYGKRTRDIPER
jgi:hypothetical protein